MKNILAIAAGLILFDWLNNSKKENAEIKGYEPFEEKIFTEMSDYIGAIDYHFPSEKLTAKERKKLLEDSLDFEESNIEMIFKYKNKENLVKITSSEKIFDFVKKVVPRNKLDYQEMVVLLFLDNALQIQAHDILHFGGINSSIVDVRLIVQKAILMLSKAVVVIHNHPSGTNKPSKPDIAITAKLKKAFSLIDIQLLDHLIITDIEHEKYFSFADHEIL